MIGSMVFNCILIAVNNINVVYGLFYKGAWSLLFIVLLYIYMYFVGDMCLISLYLTFLY